MNARFLLRRLARVLAIVSSGLLAGAFAYGFFTVVPTFDEVPRNIHFAYRIALMKHNGIYVQIVMALGIVTPLWWAYTMKGLARPRKLAMSASLLALSSLLVTRFGNVPINQLIKTWPALAPPADYPEHLRQWLRFNNMRTATAVASFLFVVMAETASRKSEQL